MSDSSIVKRVAQLERQVAELQTALDSGGTKTTKDWRRTIGMFTDDEGMKAIFEEARALRDADRRKVRASASKRRKPTP